MRRRRARMGSACAQPIFSCPVLCCVRGCELVLIGNGFAEQIPLGSGAMTDSPLDYSLRNVVLQPTTRCNLDCSYCYLPFAENRRMAVAIAEKVAADLHELAVPATIIWHGGEPLATGRAHFEALVCLFEELRARQQIEHVIQTNATLIDDDWCELFRAYDLQWASFMSEAPESKQGELGARRVLRQNHFRH